MLHLWTCIYTSFVRRSRNISLIKQDIMCLLKQEMGAPNKVMIMIEIYEIVTSHSCVCNCEIVEYKNGQR